MVKLLSYLFGLTITLELFKFRVVGVTIYPNDFIFFSLLASLIFVAFKTDSIKNNALVRSNYTFLVVLFFLTFYLSSISFFGPIVNQGYLTAGLKFVVKFSLVLLFLLIFVVLTSGIRENVTHFLIKGFMHSIVIHAVFSWWFLFDWYTNQGSGFFALMRTLSITDESVGHPLINYIFRPFVRTAGLHWDPAYFGLWGAIFIAWLAAFSRYSIKRKTILFILVVPVWFLTISKTAYVALFMTMVIIFIMLPSRSLLKTYFRYVSLSILLISSLVSIAIYSTSLTFKDLQKIIELRTSLSGDGNNRHVMTPIIAFEAITHTPMRFLIGYGPRSSGQAMYLSSMEVPGKDKADLKNATYDIESDWGKTIANQGMFGFSLYLLLFICLIISLSRSVKRAASEDQSFLLCALTISFIAGIFYIYLDSRWLFILIILSLNYVGHSERKDVDAT